MKVSKETVAENRAALINAGAKLLKQKGFEGAAVSEICANAGLTEGAFYGQFGTKSAFAAEACRKDLSDGHSQWKARRGERENDALTYIEQYLRKAHVDDIAGGCPMATYSGEVFRQDQVVASAFTDGAAGMIDLMEQALRKRMPAKAAHERALFLIAAMAGSVAMTRALGRSDPRLGQEMLRACLKEAKLLTDAPT
jgi:TetR/AcrR family transcriptional repressor of nem operon